jgi:hypothetical protein
MATGYPITVRSAERPGRPDRPSEDRIFQTNNAVVILDGATQAFTLERSGAWIADEVGRRLANALEQTPTVDLRSLLRTTIAEVAETFGLQPGSSPSTTVSIVRTLGDVADILVLCDSPVVVMDTDGLATAIQDGRLSNVSSTVPRPPGKRDMSKPEWVERMTTFETYRNKPGGYWCVSASPEAAEEAIVTQVDLAECKAIMLMTDGVSAIVDSYQQLSWAEAMNLADTDPAELIDFVHNTELGDPDATRWTRGKTHDDKAVALLTVRKA